MRKDRVPQGLPVVHLAGLDVSDAGSVSVSDDAGSV